MLSFQAIGLLVHLIQLGEKTFQPGSIGFRLIRGEALSHQLYFPTVGLEMAPLITKLFKLLQRFASQKTRQQIQSPDNSE
jgi:hypothetical protein